MATLVVTLGPNAGQSFALGRHELILLGRDDKCTFQILDEGVSRRHMHIRLGRDEKHYAVGLASDNAVLLNGEPLDSDVPLENEDEIRLGNSVLVYHVEDAIDAQKATEAWIERGQGMIKTILPGTMKADPSWLKKD